jgi:hypothetical protein
MLKSGYPFIVMIKGISPLPCLICLICLVLTNPKDGPIPIIPRGAGGSGQPTMASCPDVQRVATRASRLRHWNDGIWIKFGLGESQNPFFFPFQMLQDKSRLGHARMLETVLAAMKVWLNDITRHKIQSRHLSDGLVDWGSLKRMAKSRGCKMNYGIGNGFVQWFRVYLSNGGFEGSVQITTL